MPESQSPLYQPICAAGCLAGCWAGCLAGCWARHTIEAKGKNRGNSIALIAQPPITLAHGFGPGAFIANYVQWTDGAGPIPPRGLPDRTASGKGPFPVSCAARRAFRQDRYGLSFRARVTNCRMCAGFRFREGECGPCHQCELADSYDLAGRSGPGLGMLKVRSGRVHAICLSLHKVSESRFFFLTGFADREYFDPPL